jgi:hypothetical protein
MMHDSSVAPRRRRLLKSGALSVALAAAGSPRAEAAAAARPDRALWISWYDLPEDGRERYLAWLHGRFIPTITKHAGVITAAHYATVERSNVRTIRRDDAKDERLDTNVPKGNRYILIVAAENANIFGNALPLVQRLGLSQEDANMLALKSGERVNIMVEAARVNGPETPVGTDAVSFSPCIQLGSFNCAYEDQDEVLAWYAQSRMPAMATLPGSVRTRLLASVSGWAKQAILYEFTSLQARNTHYLRLEDGKPDMKAWSDRIVPKLIHAPGSSNLAQRIWPAV